MTRIRPSFSSTNSLPLPSPACVTYTGQVSPERILGATRDLFGEMVHGPPSRYRDARLLLATIAEVDVLVSWNFRHVVRLDKIRLFNAVNLKLGYKPLMIYSPREVITYEDD